VVAQLERLFRAALRPVRAPSAQLRREFVMCTERVTAPTKAGRCGTAT